MLKIETKKVRSNLPSKKTTIYLRDYIYNEIKRRNMNLSGVLRRVLERELFVPFLVVESSIVDGENVNVGSVILVPQSRVNVVRKDREGKYILYKRGKVRVKEIPWEVVDRKKYFYVLE